jgi:hypothetical protein
MARKSVRRVGSDPSDKRSSSSPSSLSLSSSLENKERSFFTEALQLLDSNHRSKPLQSQANASSKIVQFFKAPVELEKVAHEHPVTVIVYSA